MSTNSVPLMFTHRVRCAVMLPESDKKLREAGASPHECQTPPEWRFETRIAGITCTLYFCTWHNGQVQRIIAERRIASRKRVDPAVRAAEAAVETRRRLFDAAIASKSLETARQLHEELKEAEKHLRNVKKGGKK